AATHVIHDRLRPNLARQQEGRHGWRHGRGNLGDERILNDTGAARHRADETERGRAGRHRHARLRNRHDAADLYSRSRHHGHCFHRCGRSRAAKDMSLSLHMSTRYTAGMDEVVYAHGSVDRARLTLLVRRSDAHGLLHLAGHGLLLLIMGMLLGLAIGAWWA